MSLISPLAIAPMIDWTETHFRVFMRLIAPKALLYTDMQTVGAIQYNTERALAFDVSEHPLALQLGGSNAKELTEAALIAEARGFAEVNLNLGCPSDRVQSGQFGACLMKNAPLVAELIATMKKHLHIPVTAKIRLGIDNLDSYEFFSNFVEQLISAGCDKLIVHARKAWLKGLSPKQNRTVPPVNYEFVYAIKRSLPHIPVVINGNISTLESIQAHLQQTDGVMLGRLAIDNPYALAAIHQALYPDLAISDQLSILERYIDYMQSKPKVPTGILLKPLYNFAHGLPGAKQWKHALMDLQVGGGGFSALSKNFPHK